MKSLLIMDLHNMIYRAAGAMPYLTHGPYFTGGIYGFVNQFCKSVNEDKPTDLLICSDKPPYSRLQEFPEYKAERKRQRDPVLREKVNEARKQVLEFIDALQISYWEYEGLEADDLIASACEQFHSEYDMIKILSNDDDLYQLFTYPNVVLIKKGELYYDKKFLRDFPNISIQDWPKVLAMAGSHNGVPGLRGVGLKTALKLIRDPLAYDKIYQPNKDILDLYEKIIRLPYKSISGELSKFKYNERKIIKLFSKYNITLIGSHRKAFTFLDKES